MHGGRVLGGRTGAPTDEYTQSEFPKIVKYKSHYNPDTFRPEKTNALHKELCNARSLQATFRVMTPRMLNEVYFHLCSMLSLDVSTTVYKDITLAQTVLYIILLTLLLEGLLPL